MDLGHLILQSEYFVPLFAVYGQVVEILVVLKSLGLKPPNHKAILLLTSLEQVVQDLCFRLLLSDHILLKIWVTDFFDLLRVLNRVDVSVHFHLALLLQVDLQLTVPEFEDSPFHNILLLLLNRLVLLVRVIQDGLVSQVVSMLEHLIPQILLLDVVGAGVTQGVIHSGLVWLGL